MIDKIRKYAEVSGFQLDAFGYLQNPHGGPVDIQKFAEMLARDCAKWIELEVVPDGLHWSKKFRKEYNVDYE